MSHAAGIDRGNRRMCSRSTSMARSSWPSAMNTRASSVTCDSSETANASTAMSSGRAAVDRFLSDDRRRRFRHCKSRVRQSGCATPRRVLAAPGLCATADDRAGRQWSSSAAPRRRLHRRRGRDQQRQENDGGDQRRIVVPPIASWRGRRRLSALVAFSGQRRLRRSERRGGGSRLPLSPVRTTPWPVRTTRSCRLWRRWLARFRSRPLRGYLRAYFLLHALHERGELHDALAQDLRLGFDRGRLFLPRLFAVRPRWRRDRSPYQARHWTTKAAVGRQPRPAGAFGAAFAAARPAGRAFARGLGAISCCGRRCCARVDEPHRGPGRPASDSRVAGAGRGATTASRGAASAATTGSRSPADP